MLVQLKPGTWVSAEMVSVVFAVANDDGDPTVRVEMCDGDLFTIFCEDEDTAVALADSLAEEVNEVA